jgi:hypothetical protein
MSSSNPHTILLKKTGKCGVREFAAAVASEDARRRPHLECISEDCSALFGSLISYQTIVHDETWAAIREGYKLTCGSASGSFIEDLHLMQIHVPQVINVSCDEPLIMNTRRSIYQSWQRV